MGEEGESVNVPVEWREELELPGEGLYFVAVRYPNGFGAYDVANWNGQEWELGYTAEVVGWVTLNSFLGKVNAGWPNTDDEEFYKKLDELIEQRKRNPGPEDEFVIVD